MDSSLFSIETNALKTPIQALGSAENQKVMDLKIMARNNKEKMIPSEVIKIAFPKCNSLLPQYQKVAEYCQDIASQKEFIKFFHQRTAGFLEFNYIFILGFILFIALIFVFRKYRKFIFNLKIELRKNNEKEHPNTKICPYCSEEILYTAKVCKHCKTKLNTFAFIKNIKFNNVISYVLLCFSVLFGLTIVGFYIYPIIIYLTFFLKSCLDILITTLGILTASFFVKSIPASCKVINAILILSLFIFCINVYKADIGNIYELPKIIAMVFVSIVILSYLFFNLKNKFKFSQLWLICLILFLIGYPAIESLYKPVQASENSTVKMEINEYKEQNEKLFYDWDNVEYKNGKWDFKIDIPEIDKWRYEWTPEELYDVTQARDIYTEEQVKFIQQHDMTDADNTEEYDKRFNSYSYNSPDDIPMCESFSNRVYQSTPQKITFKDYEKEKDISISYSYWANCGLSNCVSLDISILKADEKGKISTIFNKSYAQRNSGPFKVSADYNYEPFITISGKDIMVFLYYSKEENLISEFILRK